MCLGSEPGSPLFRDLNLDQVIASVVKGKDADHVRPFFYQPLPDIDGIVFRQGVFADLEGPRHTPTSLGSRRHNSLRRSPIASRTCGKTTWASTTTTESASS